MMNTIGVRLAITGGLLLAAPALGAQQVRLKSVTTVRYAELLPLALDSTGNFTSAGRQSAAPLTQDFELSAWDLGLPGLRAYGLVRFRGALGSELVWPRYGDHFDALVAFAELDRSAWRLRAGRQQRVSGLGIYTYDGASALWRPRSFARVEGFVGRGLARGFLEPLSSDQIRSLEPARPDQGTLFFGFAASARPARGWLTSATYQREILGDFSGLVSDRAALDASGPVNRNISVTSSIDLDLAAGAVGRARLAGAWRNQRAMIEVEGFRYRPVFDLTTIWGAFAPEGHYGAGARGEFNATTALTLTGDLSYRHYQPVTETTPFLVGVGDYSMAVSLGGRWTHNALLIDARYRLHTGYGGAESGGDVRAGWTPQGARWNAGLRAIAFQEEEQFRVADGTVLGLGADGAWRVAEQLNVRGSMTRYWHRPSAGGDVGINWSQTRALLTVEWTFGADADRVSAYR